MIDLTVEQEKERRALFDRQERARIELAVQQEREWMALCRQQDDFTGERVHERNLAGWQELLA